MKEIIELSGLKIKEFAEKFEIPYNTVRQCYNCERNAPEWLKKLIKKEITYKPLLDDVADIIIYEYYNDNGLRYRAFLDKEKTEDQIDWFNNLQQKFKDGEEGLKSKKIYKWYRMQ